MLVPNNYPDRLADAGGHVNVLDGWESYGSSADHQCIDLHWTASSRNESPSSCVNYAAYHDGYPHYNVLVDRTGVIWVLARERGESSGQISGIALDEVLRGQANVSSAASRGLKDTTSANSKIFSISAQNDGVGEPWSEALLDGMAIATAVTLECLGLGHVGYVSHHCALTARKIDLTPGHGCPDRHGWYERINAVLAGGSKPVLTLTELGMVIIFGPNGAALCGAGYWKNLDGEEYGYWSAVPGIVVQSVDQRGWDVMHAAATFGHTADDIE